MIQTKWTSGQRRQDIGDRVVGVARADLRLDGADIDARMLRQGTNGGYPSLKGLQVARVLERIARRNQPPDPIKADPLHGEETRRQMRPMRRIERPPEQPDLQSRRMGRKNNSVRDGAPETARMSRSDLPATVDAILEGRELLDADRPARVQPAGRNADLGAEAELPAISKLC